MSINWNEINNVMGKTKGKKRFPQKSSKVFFVNKEDTKKIRVLTEEPAGVSKHWVPTIRRYEICSEDERCVYCKVATDTEGVKCGYPRPTGVFWVWDYSFYHMEATGLKDTAKNYVFSGCTGATCPKCKSGIERRESGLRRMELFNREIKMLQAADDALHTKCGHCFVGSLTLQGYECKSCGVPMDHAESPYVILTCPACKHRGYPSGVFSCSNCQQPFPASILNADLNVSKFGDGATSFQPLELSDLREDIAKITLPSLKTDLLADSDSVMAGILRIKNPFGEEEFKNYAKNEPTQPNEEVYK
jgi:hypothetical protein